MKRFTRLQRNKNKIIKKTFLHALHELSETLHAILLTQTYSRTEFARFLVYMHSISRNKK